MTKTNVQSTPSNSQHHDTPNNKTHVIKFRVTAEEKASLELTCKLLNLSLSTFIRRAINLVENLLAVTRIEGGQVNLTRSIELMDEVVSEALKHINRKSKEHTIRVTSGNDFILAHIDAKLIVQVIINLVDNAIKYTPVGSVIEIHTDQKEQWVTVSVSDNGPGIPDEQKPRIFDMFYSGANKVVDSRRSLGLGLSLCKSIVTAHGGTISVSDNQPNGTVFTFTLPAGEVELHE